jgi:hypothetical protein
VRRIWRLVLGMYLSDMNERSEYPSCFFMLSQPELTLCSKPTFDGVLSKRPNGVLENILNTRGDILRIYTHFLSTKVRRVRCLMTLIVEVVWRQIPEIMKTHNLPV